MFEQVINVDRMEQTVSLFGSFDENIRLIESNYNVKVISRGSEIKVNGDAENVSKAVRAINGLLILINRGEALSEQNVRYVLSLVNEGNEDKLCEMTGDPGEGNGNPLQYSCLENPTDGGAWWATVQGVAKSQT